ncbi:AMP-binding protein [Alteromonas sp. KUL49]|uniref:AMP-binding protein n=1 Tax=Alteromonas sp. KUL49 TaxID=2480798 RepID=UPI00102EE259|nr:AMP-binding protein [Alteromonas sp. KUL49]TAP39676.1 phosphatase [Alteromonas sp. KUL49]GEA11662.1 AMP-dependent synthetase [Alteromonas sp. KUL49]
MTSALDIPFVKAHLNSSAIALQDDTQAVSYVDLNSRVHAQAKSWRSALVDTLSGSRPLVIVKMHNTIDSVVDYLTLLSLDGVVLLLHPDCSDEILQTYVTKLKPNAIAEQGALEVLHQMPVLLDCQVSVLLSTSGSTGAGKCVALSQDNLLSNCNSILAYLPIIPTDNTLLTLPLSYSYGLSVLHTHLKVGATICFTQYGAVERQFWSKVKETPIHSLSGVPSFYEILNRLRFTRMALPELRYFTQAGGRLRDELVTQFARYAEENDKSFFVMYGQTEATARMAYTKQNTLLNKPDTIGKAIPGGEFALKTAQGELSSTAVEGELCYKGGNVMLGYVSTQDDLSSFIKQSWLNTGDLARRDRDGDYKIVGRQKRFIKIAGERMNLDAIETVFEKMGIEAHCVGTDDLLVICVLSSMVSKLHQALESHQIIAKRHRKVVELEQWKLLENGKIDYSFLIGLMERDE